jgi:hypothetical protein
LPRPRTRGGRSVRCAQGTRNAFTGFSGTIGRSVAAVPRVRGNASVGGAKLIPICLTPCRRCVLPPREAGVLPRTHPGVWDRGTLDRWESHAVC